MRRLEHLPVENESCSEVFGKARHHTSPGEHQPRQRTNRHRSRTEFDRARELTIFSSLLQLVCGWLLRTFAAVAFFSQD